MCGGVHVVLQDSRDAERLLRLLGRGVLSVLLSPPHRIPRAVLLGRILLQRRSVLNLLARPDLRDAIGADLVGVDVE